MLRWSSRHVLLKRLADEVVAFENDDLRNKSVMSHRIKSETHLPGASVLFNVYTPSRVVIP